MIVIIRSLSLYRFPLNAKLTHLKLSLYTLESHVLSTGTRVFVWN